jgi:hypothetical protein
MSLYLQLNNTYHLKLFSKLQKLLTLVRIKWQSIESQTSFEPSYYMNKEVFIGAKQILLLGLIKDRIVK